MLKLNPITGLFDLVDSTGGGTTDHGSLTGLLDDDHPQYLLLAGRTGTTNDPIISLDDSGSIYGTALTGAAAFFKGLHINSKQEPALGPFSFNILNANTTSVLGPNALFAFGLNPMTFNDDATFGPSAIIGFSVGGTWTVGDDSMGGPGAQVFGFNATIQNPPGVAKHLSSGIKIFDASPVFIADGAACDVASISIPYTSKPVFQTTGGGALTVKGYNHFDIYITSDAGVAFNDNVVGIAYEGFHGAGTVPNDTAFAISDGDVIGSNSHVSISSQGPIRQMRHYGPAIFGSPSNLGPSSVSVGLELLSTTAALLPSRLTTAERNALTPVDGMLLYNSTDGVHQGRQGGAWVDMPSAAAVTGTGAAGRIAFWTGTSTLDDDADLLWDSGTNTLTVTGDATIAGKLTVGGAIDPTMVLLSGASKRFGATDSGPVYLAPFADSTTGVQVRKANNSTVVLDVDTTNGFLGVGTTPTEVIHAASDSVAALLRLERYGNATGPNISIRQARGSQASPTATQVNDALGALQWMGQGSTAITGTKVKLTAFAAETWTDSVTGAGMNFETTPIGSATRSIVMRLKDNGVAELMSGVKHARRTIADATATVAATDYVVEYTSLSAGRTINLPAAATAGAGATYILKNGTSNTSTLTVDPNGAELIDGASTKTFNGVGGFGIMRVYCTGAAWMTF